MTEMLTLDAFEEASAKVQEVTQKTGLIESPHFSAQRYSSSPKTCSAPAHIRYAARTTRFQR